MGDVTRLVVVEKWPRLHTISQLRVAGVKFVKVVVALAFSELRCHLMAT